MMVYDGGFLAALFFGAILIVMASVAVGHRLGLIVYRGPERERESSVSAVASAVLALLAFLLAFTFSLAAGRFDTRKGLVLDEANKIRTAWVRSDFLPQPDRTEAKKLFREYLSLQVSAVQSLSKEQIRDNLALADRIQSRLWEMAVANGRQEMNSDIGALYIDALNQVAAVHASRVAVALQLRIPTGVWLALAGLTILAMTVVGYQSGIAGASRTKVMPLMAVAFGLVITMIGALDRPAIGLSVVPQDPLIDLLALIDAGTPEP